MTTLTLDDIKAKQQATWSSGAYEKIAWLTVPLADRLCDAVDLRAGSRVLDVATGTGHVAIAAARRFCMTAGVDYVPSLVDIARRRATAEDLDVAFEVGDAEALGFEDASFDYVLSSIGVMFTANHAAAANELVRVCRPGGKIGMINWTPTGFVGDIFRTIGKHVPPPAAVKPAGLWGTAAYLEELFGDRVALRTETRTIAMRFLSPEHFADFFIANYGPTHKAHGSLDPDGARALRDDLVGLAASYNRASDGSAVCDFGYIAAVATKH